MKFIRKISNAIHSRTGAYIFFLFSVFAFINLKGATWAYGWIAALYPLGDKFVPTMLGLIAVTGVFQLGFLFFTAYRGEKKEASKGLTALNIIHTLSSVAAIITFIYTAILVFGIDAGFVASRILNGFNAIVPNLIFPALAGGMGLILVFCSERKKAVQALISGIIVSAVVVGCTFMPGLNLGKADSENMPELTLRSVNFTEGADILFETLKKDEKPDAANMLSSGKDCWTPQSPALAGDKLALALFSGAGGVMVFRVACDKTMDDPNSVTCGLENTLHRYAENW